MEAFLSDKAYDTNELLGILKEAHISAVIPPVKRRKEHITVNGHVTSLRTFPVLSNADGESSHATQNSLFPSSLLFISGGFPLRSPSSPHYLAVSDLRLAVKKSTLALLKCILETLKCCLEVQNARVAVQKAAGRFAERREYVTQREPLFATAKRRKLCTDMTIYANYAATSPALSQTVVKELCEYVSGTHLNAGRNFEGLQAGTIALRARKAIARLFGVADPLRVLFTGGATQSLNMAIHGLVRAGDHVLATSVEHNATARPLEALRKNGAIELDWLRCEPDGSLDAEKVRAALRKNTRLLVMSHASNVLGTIVPVMECFRIAHEYGVFTILDAAQTSGVLPFTMGDCCDVIAFAGHKGLKGLAGTGGFALGEAASGEMRQWIQGGTGSTSHSLDMPEFMPDRFEPGTQNTIGVLSLAASIEEILRTGVDKIRERERASTAHFISGLRHIKKISVCGTLETDRSVAVVSVVVRGYDAGEVSRRLFERHGIITRSGLHCSPLAHKTAGTFPGGTVRFSFGSGTTEAELDTMLEALDRL